MLVSTWKPFFFGLAAADFDASARGWAEVEGVAAGAFPTPEGEKSIQRFLDELAGEGVKLYACGMANASWIAPQEALIAQCSGSAGATAFVARCLDPDWRTQVY